MEENVKNGISLSAIAENINLIGKGLEKLNNMAIAGEIGFPGLASVDLSGLSQFAKKFQGKYEDLIVIGIGGSSLGFEAITNALLPHGYNVLF